MSLRDTLRKAAGLLVELPPEGTTAGVADAAQADVDAILSQMKPGGAAGPSEGFAGSEAPAAKTVEQILHDSQGPNLEQIKTNTTATPASLESAGAVDLAVIYQQAGLPAVPFSAEQMLEMLGSLPPELPLDTRRQTVKVTLSALGKSMGATPDSIVADASRKLAALTAHQEHVAEQTQSFTATTQQEIAGLQAEIEQKRKAIETAGVELRQLTTRCETESHRLDEVLEFFSLDVPPSKHAPGEGGVAAGAN